MNKKYDFIIVGGGLAGATFAYYANKNNKRCLIIEKKKLGGSLECENIKDIPVHLYGPHIFHTSDKDIWDTVNNLTSFIPYINSPLANYNGSIIYNLPFNMNTFNTLWGATTPNKAKEYLEDAKLKIENPVNLEEFVLSSVGREIYEIFIKGYTEKQWGKKCKDLPVDIIKRIPIRFTYNNNYFNDTYSGIPEKGYNELIQKLTENCDITFCDYFTETEYWDSLAHIIVYTGKIDEYFDYDLGELEYRSLYWIHDTIKNFNYQGNAVINYTSENVPYTRIIEHKHFYNDLYIDNPYTVISKEYPIEYNKEDNIPYYPINDKKNNDLYNEYKERTPDNVLFIGRLAEYKYYNMDQLMIRIRDIWNEYNLI